jgi:hypothetical protein
MWDTLGSPTQLLMQCVCGGRRKIRTKCTRIHSDAQHPHIVVKVYAPGVTKGHQPQFIDRELLVSTHGRDTVGLNPEDFGNSSVS